MPHLGFGWDSAAVPRLRGGVPRAEIIHALEKNMPDFVWNTAALEGNTFTFPEVQTLLDGVSVGGHRISEVHQIEDTAEAYGWLLNGIRDGTFVADRAASEFNQACVTMYADADATPIMRFLASCADS